MAAVIDLTVMSPFSQFKTPIPSGTVIDLTDEDLTFYGLDTYLLHGYSRKRTRPDDDSDDYVEEHSDEEDSVDEHSVEEDSLDDVLPAPKKPKWLHPISNTSSSTETDVADLDDPLQCISPLFDSSDDASTVVEDE